ncbi:DNA-binding transcriptional LysR family regulator [Variovorax boronicumulans]|uniref:LysR family transcriptional regulator n=1 Tax=Variovorax boronicumulans TaxID=436515 RepID=UPI0027806632|nr:LysR family transcriptional regulator [Variovorax boronicumulans]MDQ0015383.1 DNA-binding transcriptional LysR family regulator [Variovorax boronicumulans]
MDKLSAMATFATVIEVGSFTRAADVLALPKARVSQRVSELERHLGVRLLNRTTRTLGLTEEGQAYFAKCQVILRDIDELEEALKGGRLELRGRLRVEALVSVARWIIAPRLHEFQARYPAISVRLAGSDRISHLLEDGIDCAVRGGHLKDSSQIARHVCDVRVGLYAAPAYLRAAPAMRHPEELMRHRSISWFQGQRNPFAWQLEKTQSEVFDLAMDNGLQFDDPDVAIASCMAGSGICPGVPFAVEGWVRAGALVPVLPDWSFKARPIHIIYPSSKHLSARARCFVDWLLELMKSSPSVRMTPRDLADRL